MKQPGFCTIFGGKRSHGPRPWQVHVDGTPAATGHGVRGVKQQVWWAMKYPIGSMGWVYLAIHLP